MAKHPFVTIEDPQLRIATGGYASYLLADALQAGFTRRQWAKISMGTALQQVRALNARIAAKAAKR